MKRNIAIILAGGSGRRMGTSTPKQFYKVAGKMVVEHTIDAFNRNDHINEIAIVANAVFMPQFEDMLLRNRWAKVSRLLKGGKERYHSSLSAIEAYRDEEVNLIFHDAVRPLVSQQIINNVAEALRQHTAVDVAIPSTDTVIEVDGGQIAAIPDRSRLMRGQTPQAFDISVIRQAYDIALHDPHFQVTDDCGVVKKYLPDVPIYVVKGEESNIKLTYSEDTYLLDKLFQLRKTTAPQPQSGDILSLKGKVAVVFGGSKGIGQEVAAQLQSLGATVYSFSRGSNGVDISCREHVVKALKQVADETGRIDFVVNTAGVLHRQPLATMPSATIEGDISVNLLGTVNVAQAAYPYLCGTKGALLLYTSSSYTRGRALYSIYSATKAAIVNFTQAIAQEWDGDGIRVNCINPERTDTPMRRSNFGIEPPETLLTAQAVAKASVNTLLADFTGQVVDVRR